jgi:hypothetical protein
MPPYLVDANFFIQAYRVYYPIDVATSFWQLVKRMADDRLICSIDKVKDELYVGRDSLTAWCDLNLADSFFLHTETTIIPHYTTVISYPESRGAHFTQRAKDDFYSSDIADAWLIAHALQNGQGIVTYETSDPNQKSRVKIPDVCNYLNLTCINTITLLRNHGLTF